MHLPDVNVWLALAFEAHAFHRRAVAWFDGAGPGVCFLCRVTQQGFLRLATNPSVLGEDALTMRQAWACHDRLREDERIAWATEPAGIEQPWRSFTSRRSRSHRLWTDGWLAAFARAGGLELVTFDHGFTAFPELEVHLIA